MMPVKFQCPTCQSHLTVSRKYAGKRGRCPNCRSKLKVPEIAIDDPFEEIEKPSGPSGSDRDDIPDAARQRHLSESTATDMAREEVSESVGETGPSSERIAVPRWVVYFQGALLGIIATTFFIFGLAVGTGTGGPAASPTSLKQSVVSGTVYFDRDRQRQADFGAVVILLPTDVQPRHRPPVEDLRPQSFQPIRNEGMEAIRSMGGAIVRVDANGRFETEVPANQSYWLLVISNNQAARDDEIGKQTRAEMGTYFLPIEDLLGDRAFMWDKLRVSSGKEEVPAVVF